MDFVPTHPARRARVTQSFSARNKAEERYWKSFRSSVFVKSYAPIVSLDFSQVSPYRYAVTSGTRIQIYSSKTNRVVKTISKFKEIARSGTIRDDGKLVVAGDDSGLVQVFDINSRAVLRSIRSHKQPVHTATFSPTASSSSPSILTSSDDTTCKVYDLSTSKQISYLAGHADYVRTASFVPSNPSLIVSGGYDGTVKLWDTRIPGQQKGSGDTDERIDTLNEDGEMAVDREPTPPPVQESKRRGGEAREVMSMSHGHPVEKVLVHPSGTQVVSAGGPVIRVWDILSSGQCLRAMSNHQKTVTCLAWGDGRTTSGMSKKRLLSAGLDGLVKSYDLEDDYRVGKTLRVGGGILSLAMAPDESTLLIGSSSGELAIRKRVDGGKVSNATRAEQLTLKPGEYESLLEASAFNKGTKEKQEGVLEGLLDTKAEVSQRVTPSGEIRIDPRKQKKKLNEWDALLKSFRYADALDSALLPNSNSSYSFALLSELMHRDGLHQALSSRDEVSLLPILRFLFEHITDPRFGSLACDVANVVIDLYTPALGQSSAVDGIFQRLKAKVEKEVQFQRELVEVRGQLQMILAAQVLG